MEKVKIGLVAVGAVMFAVAIGLGHTTVAAIGFVLFACGVALQIFGIGD